MPPHNPDGFTTSKTSVTSGTSSSGGDSQRAPNQLLGVEVLCVEDAVQLLLYKRIVVKAGMCCTLAGSAEEALRILAERWSRTGDASAFPQQVIMGLCLPGMSGEDAAGVISERYPDAVLPVTLCSASHNAAAVLGERSRILLPLQASHGAVAAGLPQKPGQGGQAPPQQPHSNPHIELALHANDRLRHRAG